MCFQASAQFVRRNPVDNLDMDRYTIISYVIDIVKNSSVSYSALFFR